ncbi:DoxX family protein [Streptomyces sp. NPDC002668]|uniref:DoxX family protein n=1 Tax=Streptomyces sp. NPDC002668 TaxID=3154422 RepID=UPI00332CB8A2
MSWASRASRAAWASRWHTRAPPRLSGCGRPHSWMPALGVPQAAAALGLLVGFWIPSLGTAAAVDLVLFFVCAVVTHLRVRDYKFGLQSVPGAGRRDSDAQSVVT